MDLSKPYLLVACTLLYVSLLVGGQSSDDFEIKKPVSFIPDAIESLQKSSMSAYNWEIKKKVPGGPDPMPSPETPPVHSSETYYSQREVRRKVSRGSDPRTSESPSFDSSGVYHSRWGLKRQVPSGPDPETSPGTPPFDSSSSYYSPWKLKRKVLRG
ncbi:unnamed protein product [Dovyalis caffra]|uniref:Uncharacterized protein n=1 Tax=Dovyalis caffra TaxID=77055 RepID=A0AAV1QZ86_9ROSI|nr:unnamed protein product [Dovyalis caffra]